MNQHKPMRKVEVMLENHGITYRIPLRVHKDAPEKA
jgi:hypothetical protein